MDLTFGFQIDGRLVGQGDCNIRFGERLETFLKALVKWREGELLQFNGNWSQVDPDWADAENGMAREWMHVQYARDATQRELMVQMGLPGSGKSKDGHLSPGDLAAIGASTVMFFREDEGLVALREARVLTWPQLMMLGMERDYTCLETFVVGCLMEKICSVRERPWKSELTRLVNGYEKGTLGARKGKGAALGARNKGDYRGSGRPPLRQGKGQPPPPPPPASSYEHQWGATQWDWQQTGLWHQDGPGHPKGNPLTQWMTWNADENVDRWYSEPWQCRRESW